MPEVGEGRGWGRRGGVLDSAKEQGITGILLNWRDPTEYKGRGFVSLSRETLPSAFSLLAAFRGLSKPEQVVTSTPLLKNAIK